MIRVLICLKMYSLCLRLPIDLAQFRRGVVFVVGYKLNFL